MKIAYFIPIVVLLAGCFQMYSEGEEELRIIPVTNNPSLIPKYGGVSGMGAELPY